MAMRIESKLLLKPEDMRPTNSSFRVRGVLNPAGVRLSSGGIMLLARIAETPKHGERFFLAPRFGGKKKTRLVIEKIPRKACKWEKDCFLVYDSLVRLPTISHLRRVILDKNGFDVKSVSRKQDFAGLENDGDFGVEDARITMLAGEKKYAMTYVSVSMSSGVSTSLALSDDLKTWDRQGIIFRQQNKDVVIYPEKIRGYYVALHRPEGTMIFDKPRIWVSYSKDLVFWGRDRPVMGPRKNSWDEVRIGAGAVPVRVEEGWLAIYHGVRFKEKGDKDSGKVYSAGAALFAPDNPEKILARTPVGKPLFAPLSEYEKSGFVNNVVFPTAALHTMDGKSLLVYSGAADSSISVRKIRVQDILNSLE